MELINHIKNNFVLYGFGDEPNAVWQCVRELVENGKDAIKKLMCKQQEFDIHYCVGITLRSRNDQPELLEVQCLTTALE